MRRLAALTLTLALAGSAGVRADGPADNLPDNVRRVPPPGVKISEDDRAALRAGVEALGKQADAAREAVKDRPELLALLPDVLIFHKAVDWALRFDEFFDPKEVAVARDLLRVGGERAEALKDGKAPWLAQTGLVVRGYRSRIDGSVQPYGLVIPAGFKGKDDKPYRLDLWWHGRGEKLSELSFINGRMKSPGEFVPPGAFVLHPYGRYCNANRFAGEVDTFEAIGHAKKYYPIDENRIVARGFSMGGAACWQYATHYPGVFAAAAPGAGFSETADFLKVFQKEEVKPTEVQRKLWHLYDATDWAGNLFNLPTVAYSGEKDSQKQAADQMALAFQREGLELPHIIGVGAGHNYTADAKKTINERIDAFAAKGRDVVPQRVRFTTYTLRYDNSFYVTVDELTRHWERGQVNVNLADGKATIETQGVEAFTLALKSGQSPLEPGRDPGVRIGGAPVKAPAPAADKSWTVHFRKVDGKWQASDKPFPTEGLRKRHGLQGPIDDAFLDRFLIVRPTGKPLHEATGKWAQAELEHATDHWRRQFRGEAPIKADDQVTDADIADSNLILFGDVSSNKLMARVMEKFPNHWTTEKLSIARQDFDASRHMPVLIYPNPLNPNRYVVFNSGFTFREYDYLNNARQTPKLGDYAVVDVTEPRTSRSPGKVVLEGFFDEKWRFPEPAKAK